MDPGILPSALLVVLLGLVLLLWLAGHWKVTSFPPGRLCQEVVLPESLLVALLELVLPMPLCCWTMTMDPGILPSAPLVVLLGLDWKVTSFPPGPLCQEMVLPVSLLVALLELVLPMPLQRRRAMNVDPGILPSALLVVLLELVLPMPLPGMLRFALLLLWLASHWKATSFPPGRLCQEVVLPESLLVALLELVLPMPLRFWTMTVDPGILPSALLVVLLGLVLLLWLAGHWKVTSFPPGRLCQEVVLPESLLVALLELVLPMPLCCWTMTMDPGILPSAPLVVLLGLDWKVTSFPPGPLCQEMVLPVSLLVALLELVLPMPLRFWTMTVDPGSLPSALLVVLLVLVLTMPLPGMLRFALLLLWLAGHWKVTSFPPGRLCQEVVLPESLLVALLELVLPMPLCCWTMTMDPGILPSALLVVLLVLVLTMPLPGMLRFALLLLWLAGHWKVTYFPPGRLCQEMVLPVSLLVALFELVLPMPLCCWLDPGIPPSALLVALLGLVPMPLPGTVPLALLLLQLARHWKAASFLPPKPWPLCQALVLPVSLLVAVLELVLPMPLRRCWAMKVDPGVVGDW